MGDSRKIAVVTGGTDGIGKEIAHGLAMRGLRVIIIGRNKGKGVQAEREIRQAAGHTNVEFLEADLSLMAEANRLLFDPFLGQSREEAADAALHLLLSKDLEGMTGGLFLKITKLKQVASELSRYGSSASN
jgi:NAD(P)-dependent dehydrogenase (short-subunit alcohol dehydrogenase family)